MTTHYKNLVDFAASFGTDAVETEVQFGTDAAFYIWLKPLSSKARDAFEASVVGKKDGDRDLANLRARLVAMCWVDPDTQKPVGTPDEVGAMRADAVAAIFEAVRKMNGMDSEAADEAKND